MQRRTFIGAIVVMIQAALAAVVGLPGIRMILAPLSRRRGETGFVRVGTLEALVAGQATRVVVSADRHDAFTHHPPGPIGSVWLIRDDSDDPPRVRCLQTICPHLGCGVELTPDRSAFTCPCHTSDFDEGGQRRLGPSPRDMDELACRVTEPDPDGKRWVEVQYQEFRTGVADKMPVI